MFERNDKVYWYWFINGVVKKYYGFIQRKLRELYFIIDLQGKEWIMYADEIRKAHG